MTEGRRSVDTGVMDDDAAQHLQAAKDALRVSNALSEMAVKYGPKLVMDTVRYWLDYMDKQVARNDSSA